ncbi:hypothetical protein J4209_05715 [Candidatus Woesearchaeota archaeon]|nr:hypothetical protein [Candidatus Woesearchaeota archaeon]
MTRINIELDDELHKKVRLNALLKGKTLITYIQDALREAVKEDEKKNKK